MLIFSSFISICAVKQQYISCEWVGCFWNNDLIGMFTGVVSCRGEVVAMRQEGGNCRWVIRSKLSKDLVVGQSVSHQGVCLSIERQEGDCHEVVAIEQTLGVTNLGQLVVGSWVNIEPALLVSGRLEGHIVQGHVDAVLTCREHQVGKGSWCFVFDLPRAHAFQVVEKGSICLDGVSLTTHDVKEKAFSVSIIPQTWERTTFSSLQVGGKVHAEFDVLAKYVARRLAGQPV